MPREGDKRTVTPMGYIPGLPLAHFLLLYLQVKKEPSMLFGEEYLEWSRHNGGRII